MKRFSGKTKIAAGGVMLLLLGGGGGALATTEFSSPGAANSQIISDAAGQLNVTPSALSAALIKAIDDQLNAEVTAGQLSQAQATALQARLASGHAPLFNLGGRPAVPARLGVGLAVGLGAAETYLGLSATQIRTDMQGGQTLAQIAVAQGKTAAGLIAALLSAEEAKLSAAVTAGTISSAQQTTIETKLQNAITALVNGMTTPGVAPGPFAGVAPFARIGSGGFGRPSVPFTGMGGGFAFGAGSPPQGRIAFSAVPGVALDAVTSYLGLTATQLRADLENGQTLAAIAVAQGKTADGLIAAVVSAQEAKLAAEVAAGTLSSAVESMIEQNLQSAVSAEVNATAPALGHSRGFHIGVGPRGSTWGRSATTTGTSTSATTTASG
jgi:hypothetical protein